MHWNTPESLHFNWLFFGGFKDTLERWLWNSHCQPLSNMRRLVFLVSCFSCFSAAVVIVVVVILQWSGAVGQPSGLLPSRCAAHIWPIKMFNKQKRKGKEREGRANRLYAMLSCADQTPFQYWMIYLYPPLPLVYAPGVSKSQGVEGPQLFFFFLVFGGS